MKVKRYSEIDVLYTIGTLLVIFGHAHSSDWDTFAGTILDHAIAFVYTFHMPLFIFVAGFLFMNSDSLKRKGYSKWIAEKALKLLTPYAVLSVAAMVPKFYFENQGFGGFHVGYLLKVLLEPRLNVWGHFWFLPVLLLLYAVFGIWSRFVTERNRKAALAGALIVSITLYFLPFRTYWLGFSDFKAVAVFFVIGMIVNLRVCNRKHTLAICARILWLAAAIIISLLLTDHFYQNKVVMLIVAVVMISACWQVAAMAGDNRLTSWMSRHNFTVYIYSWPFQAAVMVLCTRLSLPWYVTTPCMFVIGLAAPISMVLVYEKMKKLHCRFFDLLLGIK